MTNAESQGMEHVEMLSKKYQVFYWIKKNNTEYLHHMFVMAKNQKEAVKKCRDTVYEQTGKHAFRPTTKAPASENYFYSDDWKTSHFSFASGKESNESIERETYDEEETEANTDDMEL